MSDLLFDSWAGVARVFLLCLAGYAGLLVLLRAFGKRSTSKLNMFDWVVTVALGSLLAAMVLGEDVPLAHGLTAYATLIGLQYVLARVLVRWKRARHAVLGDPTLLYYEGRFLRERMRRVRVLEEEIHAAVRAAGLGSMDEVRAVVLETSAEISVVRRDLQGDGGGVLGALAPPPHDDPPSRG